MPNNAATLNGYLATALRDTSYGVWTTGEMDNLVAWAIAMLPHYGIERENDSSAVGSEITIVSGTYYYSFPTGMTNVYRVDIKDSGGTWQYAIEDGGWEITGDARNGGGKLRFPASVNDTWAGGKYVVHGYGTYDLTTNYIPDAVVPLVTAIARAEAYRRMSGSRAKFETWLAANQSQNVTVNELLLLVNEADAEANRLARQLRRWHKPVPGRI